MHLLHPYTDVYGRSSDYNFRLSSCFYLLAARLTFRMHLAVGKKELESFRTGPAIAPSICTEVGRFGQKVKPRQMRRRISWW
jgi:hypothetical protein